MQVVIDRFAGLSGELQSVRDSTSEQGQLLQLVNQVLMQNVAGPVNESARLLGDLKADVHGVSVGANKATEGMASLAIKLMKEIESMRKEIVTLRADVSSSNNALKEQSDRIDVLSKRKGLLFLNRNWYRSPSLTSHLTLWRKKKSWCSSRCPNG